MNKIEILSLLAYLCVAGLFIYAWQTAGTKEINWKKLILPVTLAVLATIFTILNNIEEKKQNRLQQKKLTKCTMKKCFHSQR